MHIEAKFIKPLVDKKTWVTLFLMNGFQMRGIITDYDEEAILFNCEGTEQMIYKHAISTVKPN